MSNKNLKQAKAAKKDEFYTQLSDIEKELVNYEKHFVDKTVFCNCDDPKVSNFFVFFSHRFRSLGLKRLITSCYKNQNPDLFSQNDCEKAIWLDYHGELGDSPFPTAESIGIKQLQGDGDFRSKECIELLKQADIVSTNPPFSLFREYIEQLIEYDKKFIIIGNINQVTSKGIFPLIMNNKMWLGQSIHSGDREFGVSKDYPLYAATHRVDKAGNKYIRVKGVRWFTNLDYKERHEDIGLTDEYTPEKYPKYDNYDAIEVDKTLNIPCDYDGVMGVPISFLDRYNPDQFEILGATQRGCHDAVPDTRKYDDYKEYDKNTYEPTGSSGSKTNENAVLLGRDYKKNYFVNSEGRTVHSLYSRIFIRRKR